MEQGEEQLVVLVNAWAAYSTATPNADIAGFCLHYLTERTDSTLSQSGEGDALAVDTHPVPAVEHYVKPAGDAVFMPRPEIRLGELVGRMAGYIDFYSKKAMQPFRFSGVDDPVYLLALVQMGTPKKSELIYEMVSEFASGIEIINRLVRLGLIDEFPDEHDRRSKRLRITPAGLAMIYQVFPAMEQLLDVAFGSLTAGEKALLVQLLDKLYRYHDEHYKRSKNADFEEVYNRMVGKKDQLDEKNKQ
ncbi:MarR family winged helix-turn-helix transcriptional regulator [Spirosoma arcticum]